MEQVLAATPRWAIGGVGVLLTTALTLQLIGVEFSRPINAISDAYAEAIVRRAQGQAEFRALAETMQTMINRQETTLISTIEAMGQLRTDVRAATQLAQEAHARIDDARALLSEIEAVDRRVAGLRALIDHQLSRALVEMPEVEALRVAVARLETLMGEHSRILDTLRFGQVPQTD